MNKHLINYLELAEAQVSQVRHEKMMGQNIHESCEDQQVSH